MVMIMIMKNDNDYSNDNDYNIRNITCSEKTEPANFLGLLVSNI